MKTWNRNDAATPTTGRERPATPTTTLIPSKRGMTSTPIEVFPRVVGHGFTDDSMDHNSRTRSTTTRRASNGLTAEERQLMVFQDIHEELERANEQRAELLALLRAAVEAEGVTT